jgi:prepilin-type N-terminal cleavage/methylation domain-containing protein
MVGLGELARFAQYHIVIPIGAHPCADPLASLYSFRVVPPLLTNRRGMTLIEVMFAVVILSGVMLALTQFGQAFTRATRDAATLGIASDLATARLEAIRAYPVYDSLSRFAGTETAGTAYPSMAGFDGFTRQTAVATRQTTVSGRLITEYKTVTVTVTSPTLSAPVAKSVDIPKP